MVKKLGERGRARHTRRRRKRLDDVPLSSYVATSIGLLIVYTISELVLASITGLSHDTLTTCFYAAFGGEILTCGLIKIYKLKEEDKPKDDEEG